MNIKKDLSTLYILYTCNVCRHIFYSPFIIVYNSLVFAFLNIFSGSNLIDLNRQEFVRLPFQKPNFLLQGFWWLMVVQDLWHFRVGFQTLHTYYRQIKGRYRPHLICGLSFTRISRRQIKKTQTDDIFSANLIYTQHFETEKIYHENWPPFFFFFFFFFGFTCVHPSMSLSFPFMMRRRPSAEALRDDRPLPFEGGTSLA